MADPQPDDDQYVQEEEVETIPGWQASVTLQVQESVETGEEEEDEIYSQRSKLYRFRDGEWKERGIGDAKLLKHRGTGRVRFLLRQEKTQKVQANHLVVDHHPYCQLSPNMGSEKCWVWCALDHAEDEPCAERFALKFKDAPLAQAFKEAFDNAKAMNAEAGVQLEEKQECAPAATSPAKTSPAPKQEKAEVLSAKAEEVKPEVSNPFAGISLFPSGTSSSGTSLFPPGASGEATAGLFSTAASTSGGGPFSSLSFNTSSGSAFSATSAGVGNLFQPSGSALNGIATATALGTGEEELYSNSAKLFFQRHGAWDDGAVGVAKILKCKDEPKYRFTFVQDGSGTTLASHAGSGSFCEPTISAEFEYRSCIWTASDEASGAPEVKTFALKFATAELAEKFREQVQSLKCGVAPGSKSGLEASGGGYEAPVADEDGMIEQEEVVHIPGWQASVTLQVRDDIALGEEDEEELYKQRAKLFRFADGEWKERGLGDAKLLKNSETGMVRFLLRQEKTGKIAANHVVVGIHCYCDLVPNADSDKIWTWSAQDFSDDEPCVQTFALKLKTTELAAEFKIAFDSAKEMNAKLPVFAEQLAAPANDAQQGSANNIGEKLSTGAKEAAPVANPFAGISNTAPEIAGALGTSPSGHADGVSFFSGIGQNAKAPEVASPEASSGTGGLFGQTGASLAGLFGGSGTAAAAEVSDAAVPKPGLSEGTGGLFGKPSSPSSGGLFGGSSPGGGTSSGGLFGGSSSSPLGGLFGGSSSGGLFGGSSASSGGLFSSQATGGGLFSKPASPSSGGLFSGSSSPASGGLFGKPPSPSSGGLFGAPAASSGGGLFGKPSSPSSGGVFNTSSSASSSGLFASTAPTTGGLFGGGTGGSLFGGGGSASGGGMFGGLGAAVSGGSKAAAVPPEGAGEEEYMQEEEVTEVFGWAPSLTLEVKETIETGQEDEEELYSQRSKLYRFRDGEWKERGLGDAKILKHKITGKIRFLMRQERTMKVVANFLLMCQAPYCDLRISPSNPKLWVWTALDWSEETQVTEKFALKFKTEELAQEFKVAFDSAKGSGSATKAATGTTAVPKSAPAAAPAAAAVASEGGGDDEAYDETYDEANYYDYDENYNYEDQWNGGGGYSNCLEQMAAQQNSSGWRCGACGLRWGEDSFQCGACEAYRPGYEDQAGAKEAEKAKGQQAAMAAFLGASAKASAPTSVFAAASAQTSAGGLGAASASSLFGGGATGTASAGSLFGGGASGAASSGGLFSGATTSSAPITFGSSFATLSSSSAPAFGASAPAAFGAPVSAAVAFGAAASTNAAPLQAKSAAFGIPPPPPPVPTPAAAAAPAAPAAPAPAPAAAASAAEPAPAASAAWADVAQEMARMRQENAKLQEHVMRLEAEMREFRSRQDERVKELKDELKELRSREDARAQQEREESRRRDDERARQAREAEEARRKADEEFRRKVEADMHRMEAKMPDQKALAEQIALLAERIAIPMQQMNKDFLEDRERERQHTSERFRSFEESYAAWGQSRQRGGTQQIVGHSTGQSSMAMGSSQVMGRGAHHPGAGLGQSRPMAPFTFTPGAGT